MKVNKSWIGNALLKLTLALCCLDLSGCSTTVIKTAEQPPLQTGSALRSLKPLKLCLKDFQDLRGTEPDVIFDVAGKKYQLDKPVATWVRDSIRREFERNGHTCVGPEREKEANVVIDGSVYQYSLDVAFFGIATSRFTGNVGAKISATAPNAPAVPFAKKYDGSFYASSRRMTIDTVIKIQNEALLAMIKELTSDQEFLDFLKRQQPP